jgi:hypothetical protein
MIVERQEAERVERQEADRMVHLREAERIRDEQEEHARKKASMEIAKSLKKRIMAGETVYLYESVYLDVDSRVVDDLVCHGFSLGLLHKLGLEGWEIMSVVPRTVGIALTNHSYGASLGETWGAGVGGNVVGVHVLIRLTATPTSCPDRMLFDYVLRHLDTLGEGKVE